MNTIPTTTAVPSLRHRDWMTAATEEYGRLAAVLRELSDDEWQRPTDCDEWTVREMVAHVVGAAEAAASVREMGRQMWLGRRLRPGADGVDGMNAVQVQERAADGPEKLRDDLATAWVRGVRRRSRLPAVLRALPIPFGPPLGIRPLGYLMDRIYTRDAWMHRVDLSRAIGRPLQLTADHDGRIVADVVAEWARVHGRPYRLTLSGPAGGTWRSGTEGEEITMDAVEFCRIMSGRGSGAGLLTRTVPF
jgi:uncharacterized protein (TIGR03083 family)